MQQNRLDLKTNSRCEKKITYPRFVLAKENKLTYHTTFVRFSPEPPQVFGHRESGLLLFGEKTKSHSARVAKME
jgi:hypothetical protein